MLNVWRIFREKETPKSFSIVKSYLLLENFRISPRKSSVVFRHVRQSSDILGSLRKSEIIRNCRKMVENSFIY